MMPLSELFLRFLFFFMLFILVRMAIITFKFLRKAIPLWIKYYRVNKLLRTLQRHPYLEEIRKEFGKPG